MVILHFAPITKSPFSGVNLVVPRHVSEQSQYAQVGLVNLGDGPCPGCSQVWPYERSFSLDHLPEPFCRPDLAVFHTVYSPAFVKIAKELREKNIPYILVPHGSLQEEAMGRKALKKRLGNLLLFGPFLKGAAAIQCLSPGELKSTHFGGRKFVATNGMDLPLLQKKAFRTQGMRITFIGRLDPHHKGLDLLLEGVKEAGELLRSAGTVLHLYGPDYRKGQRKVETLIQAWDLSDLVVLHPAVTGKEKEAVLLDSDLFIQTSRFEGMPLGILEAMSYGIPCLVTEGTTLGDLVRREQAGWACETNARAIAAALREAVENRDQYPVRGENARRAVQAQFSWETVAKETLRAYGEISGLPEKKPFERGNLCT